MKEIVMKTGTVILVDDDKYDFLNSYTWWDVQGYARTIINGKNVYMHRMLLNAPKDMLIDHINRNRSDNRMEILDYVQTVKIKPMLKNEKTVRQLQGRTEIREEEILGNFKR